MGYWDKADEPITGHKSDLGDLWAIIKALSVAVADGDELTQRKAEYKRLTGRDWRG